MPSHSSEFGTSSTKTHTNKDICDRICERDHILHSQIFDEFQNFHIYDSETALSKIQVPVLILKSVVLSIPGIYTFVILAFFEKLAMIANAMNSAPKLPNGTVLYKTSFVHYCCTNASSIKHPHF